MAQVGAVLEAHQAHRRGAAALIARTSRRPAIATHPAVVLVTSLLFAVGGVLVLLSTALPAASGYRSTALVRSLDIAGITVSVVLVLLGPRIPQRLAIRLNTVLILLGTTLVAVAVHNSGGGSTAVAYACLFFLPPFYAFFVMPPVLAAGALLLTVGVGALSLRGLPGVGASEQVILWGMVVTLSATVGWLVRAADQVEVDTLTGLPNRRGAERAIDAAVSAASLERAPVVALLDLDHFRTVNKVDGRGVGDALLQATALAWSAQLPAGAVLARYGGDEFLLVLPGASAGDADAVAAVLGRLREALPRGTCSVGTATWEPDESDSMLVARTDVALYAAKRAGRGRVHHHPGSGAGSQRIREGLRNGEFRVHFQPVVALSTGVAVGAEALVRWQHPERGLLAPVEFLPAAEHDGAITALGAWVLHESCRQAALWPRNSEGAPMEVAVNASGRELQDPRYADTVTAALDASGLAPDRLTIELVENEYDIESLHVASNLHRLAALSVRTAIDDFGTGYSSLDRLRRQGVDALKIDRTFVADITSADDEAPLVLAVLGMARALGLQVIAEGIETSVQAEWLRRHGCDLGQGYLFGRAEPGTPQVLAWAPVALPRSSTESHAQ